MLLLINYIDEVGDQAEIRLALLKLKRSQEAEIKTDVVFVGPALTCLSAPSSYRHLHT